MGIEIRIFMMISIMLCLRSAVHAAQGNAVYHPPPHKQIKKIWKASACFGKRENGRMVAGVIDALWSKGKACGRRCEQ
ncbi:hypothetical protein CICLE_v10010198mg [Citrus x clementina]|uniref:Uncharacterized protein n=1 Tax=Citrus clementina TaxID=85681 RepID=V4WJ01_CITCL|nr:hypothetical protein CICLE_v10010198mg [Citrus x clementina]